MPVVPDSVNVEAWWSIPATILACLGIIGVFFGVAKSVVAKDKAVDMHTKTIAKHSKLLEKYADHDYISGAACQKGQEACMKQQESDNTKIIKSIDELKHEVREDREGTHSELMKINKAMGRIEGVIGRLRFNSEGELK